MDAIVIEQFGDASVLQWKTSEAPQPSPDQIAIKVSVTSVNFADTLWRKGRPGAKVPFTPGLDCAGTVAAVGANVRNFKVGQRVAAFVDGGSYAEIALARPVLSYAIPEGVSDEEACGLVVLVTAWNLIHLAGESQSRRKCAHSRDRRRRRLVGGAACQEDWRQDRHRHRQQHGEGEHRARLRR